MGLSGVVGAIEMMYVVPAASLGVLGLRRKLALRRGAGVGAEAQERLAELEQRMSDLDATQMRVLELEERLDFAERVLTQGRGERAEERQ